MPRRSIRVFRTQSLRISLLLAVVASTPGCGRSSSVDPGLGLTEAEPTMKSVTAFGETLELFLEHPPAVVGKDAKLNVHLTVVKDGTPIRSGSLRVVATGPDGKSESVEQDAPRRPGIYGPTIRFPEAGRNELAVTLKGDQAEETIRIHVEVDADEAAAANRDGASEDVEPEGAVPFLKEQQWKIGLVTAPVGKLDLAERLIVPGEIVPAAGARVVVTPPVAGRLLPPPGGSFPRVGQEVRAGQVVAAVEPPLSGPQGVQFLINQAQIRTLQTELLTRLTDIEVQIRTAEIELEHARTVHQRTSNLLASNAVSRKQVEEDEHLLHIAEEAHKGKLRLRAPYEQAIKRISALLGEPPAAEGANTTPEPPPTSPWQAVQISLKAPQDGTVTDAQVVEGEYADPSRPLLTIINLRHLWLQAKVSEFDLERVVKAPAAEFRLAAYPGRRFPMLGGDGGKLIDVGSVVDPQSRTILVRYEIPNADRCLRVGLLADVAIETGRVREAVAVPESAIVQEDGRPIAYVLLDGESFQKRDLELGLKDGGMVQVKRGLEPGERVVVKGAYAIRLSSVSGAIPAHGHSH